MNDTTALSYWLNWRFALCALWILIAFIAAGTLITKYEVVNKKSSRKRDDELGVEPVGILYEDETWRSSIKALHPAWLLAYRLVAFGVLLSILVSDVAKIGAGVLFFYTQWTFALLTFYFALVSLLSTYGCYQHWDEGVEDSINHVDLETEQSTLKDPLMEDGLASQRMPMKPRNHGKVHVRTTAGPWGYFCQIVFQICAGSVGLTDSVFWLIIYPFLTPPTYQLTFLHVSMHSVNAVLLLIEVFLNRLRFPFFRLAYFGLWTCIFVIFQWILHACISIQWPYIFLDLSSPYAPIWYLGAGLIHLPVFGIFALIVKWKQLLLSRFS